MSHKNRPSTEKKAYVGEFCPKGDGCPTPRKNAFETRAKAKAYLKRHQHDPSMRRQGMAAYLCVCGRFHIGLTHPEGREKSRVIAVRKVDLAQQVKAPATG